MNDNWLDVASSLAGVVGAGLILFCTRPGRRFVRRTRQNGAPNPIGAAIAVALGALVAACLVWFLGSRNLPTWTQLLTGVVLAGGAGGLTFMVYKAPPLG
jgi:hypothetical protein